MTADQITNDLDTAAQVLADDARQRAQFATAAPPARKEMPPISAPAKPNPDAAAANQAAMEKAQTLIALRARRGQLVSKLAATEKIYKAMNESYTSNGRLTYNGKHVNSIDMSGIEYELQEVSRERQKIDDQIEKLQK